MERINLSKNEKKVLLLVASGQDCSDTLPMNTFVGCVYLLESRGLVKAAYTEGGGVDAARLTQKGRYLLAENPTLSNWWHYKPLIKTIVLAISAIGGLAGFIALLRTCN